MNRFRNNTFLSRGEQYRLTSHLRTYERRFRNVRYASQLAIKSNEASSVGDGRTRLSQLWVPTGGIAASSDEDSLAKLVRAGFLRQAHSGIFHMLPLGRRVQDKLEALIDKHMYGLGASKVSLSSISSQELWAKSGRLANVGSELFQFKDRKDAKYLLSPTHEEEITTLVSSTTKSYKELPIRLYQITRKYRDERRPRHGLLRSREFIMKDLYTFDHSSELALKTYDQVRDAYARIFDELKLPYLVAEADSGDIGGDLSHEYHFPTSKGEDNIISCTSCDYVVNEELAEPPILEASKEIMESEDAAANVELWHGISKDRLTLINVWYAVPPMPKGSVRPEVNPRAVKDIFPDLDSSVDDPLALWTSSSVSSPNEVSTPQKLINLLDHSLSPSNKEGIRAIGSHLQLYPASMNDAFKTLEVKIMFKDSLNNSPLSLLRIRDGDICPRCPDGKLKVQKAIELGHTFHLGTRYSKPLGATIKAPISTTIEAKDGAKSVEVQPAVAENLNDRAEADSPIEVIDAQANTEEVQVLPEVASRKSDKAEAESLSDLVNSKENAEDVQVPVEAKFDTKDNTGNVEVRSEATLDTKDGAEDPELPIEAAIEPEDNLEDIEVPAEVIFDTKDNAEDAGMPVEVTSIIEANAEDIEVVSAPINTEINQTPAKPSPQLFSEVHYQMGCHGIGVSRMIGAVADTLVDSKGLNWPRVMAPYEVVIVAGNSNEEASVEVYDTLGNLELDVILDDRNAFFPWKMRDADLIGYPIIVVIGKSWKSERKCEVQCRRLGIKQNVPIAELAATVTSLLERL